MWRNTFKWYFEILTAEVHCDMNIVQTQPITLRAACIRKQEMWTFSWGVRRVKMKFLFSIRKLPDALHAVCVSQLTNSTLEFVSIHPQLLEWTMLRWAWPSLQTVTREAQVRGLPLLSFCLASERRIPVRDNMHMEVRKQVYVWKAPELQVGTQPIWVPPLLGFLGLYACS